MMPHPYLYVSILAVLVPHLFHLPIWLSIATLLCVAWRYAIGFYNKKTPSKPLRLLVSVLLLGGTFVYFGTVFGREVGTALLCLLIGLKLLECRALRDQFIVVILGFLLVLCEFLYSQSLLVLFYCVFSLVALITTLISIQPDYRINFKTSLKMSLRLLAWSVPLAALIFVFFPRIQGQLWSLPQDSDHGMIGLSDEMDPGSISRLSQSDEVAFRVEFEGQSIPDSKALYWRVFTLPETNGRQWRMAKQAQGSPNALQISSDKKEKTTYQVILEPLEFKRIPLLDLPIMVVKNAQVYSDYTQKLMYAPHKQRHYTATSHSNYRTNHVLSAHEQAYFTRLAEGRSRAVSTLVKPWLAQTSNTEQHIRNALNYYSTQGFSYTLQPGKLFSSDPEAEFLRDSRRGFCEHYAASFVRMMREMGHPARVVVGYQGGEINPLGDYLIVRQSDAHAWAEVWVKGKGWRRVDPTAAIAPERIEYGMTEYQRRLNRQNQAADTGIARAAVRLTAGWFEGAYGQGQRLWDALNHQWQQWVIEYDQSQQNALMAVLIAAYSTGYVALAYLAGLLLGLCVLYYLIVYVRAWRQEDPVVRVYRVFCKKWAKQGVPRQASEGPQTYAHRIAQQYPRYQHDVHRITALYVAQRYANSTATMDSLEQLRRLVNRLKIKV